MPTLQQKVNSVTGKLTQQAQQARWFAITLDGHRDAEETKRIQDYGVRAEILFKCLKPPPETEDAFAPRQQEAEAMFQEWENLLAKARRMERDLKPAKPKGKAQR